MKPGVYIDSDGLLFCGQTEDGGLIAVKAPLSLDELEAAGRRIVEVARRLKEAQAAAAGERPKIVELRRAASWN
jgi:hypothetical protein